MTQMDNIRNTEFIPIEDDLAGLVRVVDSLPGASAENYGLSYYLNGKGDPNYSRSHIYKCLRRLKDETRPDKGYEFYWSDLNAGRYSVGNCKNIQLTMFDDGESFRVLMSWDDPDDLIIGSERIMWKETRLVYQIGHMPVDVNDGTTVITNTERNQYSNLGSFGFSFSGDTSRKYYFKLFPVSTDNAVTNDDTNGRCAGYNYAITSKQSPYLRSGYASDAHYTYTYTQFYERVVDDVTGVVSYVKIDMDTPEGLGKFTAHVDKNGDTYYEFKSGIAYYEYLNAFLDWTGIRWLIQSGNAETYFPIGSVLTAPYHGDFGEISFEVVDFDTVQVFDTNVKHTMTLQSKYLPMWWDYNGGVVFDTNERLGVLSPSTTRRDGSRQFGYSPIYFRQLKGTVVQENTNENTMLTVSNAVRDYENSGWSGDPDRTGPANYVATIFDETTGIYEANAETTWRAGLYYECELPYTTTYMASFKTNSSTDNDRVGIPPYFPNSFPQKKEDGTEVETTYIDALTQDYNYSLQCPDGKIYSRSTGHGHWVTLASGWGLEGATARSFRVHGYNPRNNQLADRFACVQPMKLIGINDQSGDAARRIWFPDVKYFAQLELAIRRGCNITNDVSRVTYTTNLRKHVRDCTEDLAVLCKAQLAKPESDYVFAGRDGNNYVDLTKVCEDLFKVPTCDEVFFPGKKYFKIEFEAVEASTDWSTLPQLDGDQPVWYYKAQQVIQRYSGTMGENTSYMPKRIRHGGTGAVGSGVFKGVFVPLEIGKDYMSGQAIPCDGQFVTNDLSDDSASNMSDLGCPHFSRKLTATQVTTGNFESGTKYWTDSANLLHYKVELVAGTDYTIGKPISSYAGNVYTVVTPEIPEGYGEWGDHYYPPEVCWSLNGGWTEVDKDYYGHAIGHKANKGTFGYRDYNSTSFDWNRGAIRSSLVYESACYTMTELKTDRPATLRGCSIYYFQPNAERTAYGNHAWAQSNVRLYLNGPLDATTEYFRPPEDRFRTTATYFVREGSEWVQLQEGPKIANDVQTYPRFHGGSRITWNGTDHSHNIDNTLGAADLISKWEEKNGRLVYCRYAGGMPVGFKVDRHNFSRYDSYGRSPVQQYRDVGGTWTPVFDENDLWWKPQPSVNNGLTYDRLASQYWHCAIQSNGSSVTFGTSGSDYRTDFTNGTGQSHKTFSGAAIAAYGNITAERYLPRQSFLHGFLDIRYKRTSDLTVQTGKKYYFRNPYGEYEPAENVYSMGSSFNPFTAVLYEENNGFNADLEDAYAFLNAIQPVVNRNGLYGTRGARDYYSRETHVADNDVKFGATQTLDKVWFCSTAQIAGSDDSNNTVYESWLVSGWFERQLSADGERYYSDNLFALKKWRQATRDAQSWGYTAGLNGSRVKNGFTSNAHASSAYSDANAGACYWWLRTAGGQGQSMSMWGAYYQSFCVWDVFTNGETWTWHQLQYADGSLTTRATRLSPLITLG